MTLATVLFHVAGLVGSVAVIKKISMLMASFAQWLQSMVRIAIGMFIIIALHLAEALGWATLFTRLGEFEDLGQALYFSITTSTTLGYGDITLSSKWQLLSTFEAISGLLLFGASTAFLLGLMKSLFEEEPVADSRAG